MRFNCCVAALVLGAALAGSAAMNVHAAVYEVRPGEDYRDAASRLAPGDELVFLPGVHEAAAVLELIGEPDRPITLRGQREGDRLPVVQFTGRGHNLWRLRGRHIVIRDLELHATYAYAIRVERADHVRIEGCTFRDCGGGDLSANQADVHALHIVGCTFTGSRRTPVYIGQHEGRLKVTDFRFEGNLIDGRKIEGDVGYGIQLKLNVVGGAIRGNWIGHTFGPGIMVYGAEQEDSALANVVEGNVVIGARNNPGIVVGGGPSVVRDNLVMGNPQGGIYVFDYGGRNLLHRIEVIGNTAAGNGRFDFSFSGRLRDCRAENNLALVRPDGTGLRGGDSFAAANRAEPATGELLEAIDALLRADPMRLRHAAVRVPDRSLDSGALAAWLEAVLKP